MTTKDVSSDSNERYRKLAEHELQLMDGFTERLGNLEIDSASTRSDIKSLFNVVNTISAKLDNIVDRTRPNTLAIFMAAISLVSLIAVIGALAFAPVYRTIGDIQVGDAHMQQMLEGIISTRFTPNDARALKAEHDQDVGIVSESLSKRIYRNEELILTLLKENAYLQGYHDRQSNDSGE